MTRAGAGRSLSPFLRQRTHPTTRCWSATDRRPTFLDDQGQRVSPAADRRRIMKRLLATLFLLASLAAAPAAEASSELKPFVRGSWQQMLRSHAGRPTLVATMGRHLRPCKWNCRCSDDWWCAGCCVMISADLVPNLPGAALGRLEKAGLRTTGCSANGFMNASGSRSTRRCTGLRHAPDRARQDASPRDRGFGPDLEKWLDRQRVASK